MMDHYILVDRVPTLEPDLMTWARWMEGEFKKTRRVVQERIGHFRVSTIFLGLDHNFGTSGAPVLWETMVWWRKKGKHKKLWLYQDRCEGSWNDALKMHAEAVRKIHKQIVFWC